MQKILGYLLVVGLLLTAASPRSSLSLAFSSSPSSPNEVPRQPSLLGTSGGEENIDSFNVHPANRWESSIAGATVSISAGQLKIDTADTSEMWARYYRDSQTVDGDIGVRFRLDCANSTPGNFQVDLLGLNISSTEYYKLSAYNYNSTHYTIRPALTVSGAAKSWNPESAWQDYYTLDGNNGPDGLSWTEDAAEAGYRFVGGQAANRVFGDGNLIIQITGVAGTFRIEGWDFGAAIAADTFNKMEVTWTANFAGLRLIPRDSDGNTIHDSFSCAQANIWQTDSFEPDSDWTGSEEYFALMYSENSGEGNFDGNEVFRIAYVTITETTDDSDLTFYEYGTYYRARSAFNLRTSEIDYEIMDETEDEIIEQELGEFELDDYFDAYELIFDIWAGSVGSCDYLMGIYSSGGTDTDFYLDYIQAEFVEFTFTEYSITENDDSWDAVGPYAARSDNDGDGGGDDQVSAYYRLTVPEFDSCTGRFSIFENGSTSASAATITIYTVDPSDGSTDTILGAGIAGYSGNPAAPDTAHVAYIGIGGSPLEFHSLNNNRQSEATFSFHLDKQNQILSVQLQFTNSSSKVNTIGYSQDLAIVGYHVSEIIVEIYYTVLWSNANTNRVDLALTEWTLTFRDLFGLPIDLPKVDVPGGDGFLDILLLPLRAILNGIAALPELLKGIWDTLTSVEGILGLIDTVLDTIYSAVDGLEGLLTSVITEITDLQNIMNIIDSVLDTIDSVLDSILSEIQSLAGDIWSQFSSMLDDYWSILETIVNDIILEIISYAWDITEAVIDGIVTWIRAIELNGVVMGDLLDLVDTWADLFFLTANDTIDLAMLLLTTWAAVVMVGLFCLCLLNAAAVSEGNGAIFLERFTSYMMANVNPITFIIDIKLPLGLFVLPYVLFVVLTGFDWVTFFTP